VEPGAGLFVLHGHLARDRRLARTLARPRMADLVRGEREVSNKQAPAHLRFLPRAFDGTAVSEAQGVSLNWISSKRQASCDARTNQTKRMELGAKGNTDRPGRNISGDLRSRR